MDTLLSKCLFLLLRRDRDTHTPSPVASPSSLESGSNRQYQFSANWASGNCLSFQIYCRTAVKTCDPLSTLSLLAGHTGVKRRLGSPWKPDAHVHVSGINQSSGLHTLRLSQYYSNHQGGHGYAMSKQAALTFVMRL